MKKFLLFDAYGTLVELDDFYGRLLRGFRQAGAALPAEVVKGAAQQEMSHYLAHSLRASNQQSWLELLHECSGVLSQAIRDHGCELRLSVDKVMQILAGSVEFRTFPEVVGVLTELRRRGVPMGVLSNWDYQLPQVLEKQALLHYFEFVLPSTSVGFEKPARRFFQSGLRHARGLLRQLQARSCVYVGDHYEKDVLGARAAGMTPVWLVRDQRDLASGNTHDADDQVPRLRTLRDLLVLPDLGGPALPSGSC